MTTTKINASYYEANSYDEGHWSLSFVQDARNFLLTRCATAELAHVWVALAMAGLGQASLSLLSTADWPQVWIDREEAESERQRRKYDYGAQWEACHEPEPTEGEGWKLIPA